MSLVLNLKFSIIELICLESEATQQNNQMSLNQESKTDEISTQSSSSTDLNTQLSYNNKLEQMSSRNSDNDRKQEESHHQQSGMLNDELMNQNSNFSEISDKSMTKDSNEINSNTRTNDRFDSTKDNDQSNEMSSD